MLNGLKCENVKRRQDDSQTHIVVVVVSVENRSQTCRCHYRHDFHRKLEHAERKRKGPTIIYRVTEYFWNSSWENIQFGTDVRRNSVTLLNAIPWSLTELKSCKEALPSCLRHTKITLSSILPQTPLKEFLKQIFNDSWCAHFIARENSHVW